VPVFRFVLFAAAVVTLAFAAGSAHAAARPASASAAKAPSDSALVIGTRAIPPFAYKDRRGEWQGLSIDLWRDIARRLKLDYRFEEAATVGDLIDGVASGEYEAAVAAITVTGASEGRVDFSHPFFSTGLAIATPRMTESSVWAEMFEFVTWKAVATVSIVFAATVGVGLLIWLVERRINTDMDSAGEGFWASHSMLLTSQFSEPLPRSAAGRAFEALWVFASIILMTFFTGIVASALTVKSLQGRVHGIGDLPTMRVGAVAGSTGALWLSDERIEAKGFANVNEGLDAMVAGKIDAFVYDAPVLQYLARTTFDGRLLVLPDKFAPQDYAIALKERSPLRRRVNQRLLAIKESALWKKRVFEYLGER
jgi:polar amino acid transport system substrate-binding protein